MVWYRLAVPRQPVYAGSSPRPCRPSCDRGRQGRITGLYHIRVIESGDGLLITFLLPVLGDLGFANTTFSDADFGVVGILLGLIVR
ncbi:hypothetical protein OB925_20515 [Aeromonas rivipollensis]|uniref:hypothetical protein n=1 Tax=Aeromonas rivipollensis TaxID=948519 RepID=UPI00259F3283|nr:hypothetical protein [Aeromonas rivipollensis]MDM5087171.1 hypothetical protein [Aeromonas rivipollensis]MDM5099578.1 hypothetical protein [Aeromonas rivipollensis]MDM5108104.1 hypothetical protein [Aeromonas rivipollensis]